jgi:hypothetical protein
MEKCKRMVPFLIYYYFWFFVFYVFGAFFIFCFLNISSLLLGSRDVTNRKEEVVRRDDVGGC